MYLEKVAKCLGKYNGMIYACVVMDNDNKMCEFDYVLSMFSNKKKNAKKLYLDFMVTKNEVIINKKESELARKFDIELDELKGKYLNYKLSRLRKRYIKEVLKYKALRQIELSVILGITESQISRIFNSEI